jgi:tryptophanyl-tRNA synthetase
MQSEYARRWALEAEKVYGSKVAQFALETETRMSKTEFIDIWDALLDVGVWALQNHSQLCTAIKNKKSFVVLIGMRPGATFHLGHLTMMNELQWYVQKGGIPLIVYAGFEASIKQEDLDLSHEFESFKSLYRRFTGGDLTSDTIAISDQEDTTLLRLERQIEEVITARKIAQLYGWDETTSVARLRIPCKTAAAFLLPSALMPQVPSVILSDINQVTHFEVAKIASRALGLRLPTVSYRHLLQSLEGPEGRMSIKNPKSLLLLDDTPEIVGNKLKRCFSGGKLTAQEQRESGGNPDVCSFFKVANVTLPREDSSAIYESCSDGSVLCGQCKKLHIPEIAAKFQNLEPD